MSDNLTINKSTLELLFSNIIKEDKWELLFELINSKVFHINFRDKRGRNSLFWAIHKNNTEIIKKLIHLNISTTVSTGLSAMNYAIYKDNVKIIKTLKQLGLDINEIDEINSTPLIYATLYNKINSINYLIENDADIYHEDFFGNSPIRLVKELNNIYLNEKFQKISRLD